MIAYQFNGSQGTIDHARKRGISVEVHTEFSDDALEAVANQQALDIRLAHQGH